MDKAGLTKAWKLSDKCTSDIIINLRNSKGKSERFYSHSSILTRKSKFFAERIANKCIEINVPEFSYDHYVNFLRLQYISSDLHFDHLDSVKSALGILQVAINFRCEEFRDSCIQYLEASPWEDKEEEEIIKIVSEVGPVAMPILARIQPVDSIAAKNVFISAIRFATSIGGPCPPFGDEIKTAAQEQVEYMLVEDNDMPIITTDEEVKSMVRTGLTNIFSSFEKEICSILLESELENEVLLQSLSDLEWMCSILPKMDLMKEFVSNWLEISNTILQVVEDNKLDYPVWGFKLKVIEVTGKVLEAVGYGNVILSSPCRVRLLKTWLWLPENRTNLK